MLAFSAALCKKQLAAEKVEVEEKLGAEAYRLAHFFGFHIFAGIGRLNNRLLVFIGHFGKGI